MMMLITLLVVGATAYVWCTRGFFSALIHLVCVLVAGAVAFGVWEPVAYLILNKAPDRGTGAFLSGVAWSLGLALPFALTLAILRGIVDKILPANAQLSTAGDYIGGGVCGLLSGVVSAGIVVLSISFLRLPPDFGGYKPVGFSTEARGGIIRSPGAFRPWVDRITAGLYGQLSLTTLRTATPLAVYHPELDTEPGAMRLTFDGRSRNTVKPSGFDFEGWYIVGDENKPQSMDKLLKDSWMQTTQKAVDVSGEPIDRGYVAGFVVKWNSKARENVGQVVVGNGQIRLIVQNREDADDSKALHPVAMVGRTNSPTRVDYARFRFESDSTFIASVGAESESVMAFEFAVPEGYSPLCLYVKGVRVPLVNEDGEAEKPIATWPSPEARDADIRGGRFKGMTDVGPIIDPSTGKPVEVAETQGFMGELINIGPRLGFTIQKGMEQGLEVIQDQRSGAWSIVQGEDAFDAQKVKGILGLDPKLSILAFSTADNTTTVVKIDFTPSHRDAEWARTLGDADRGQPIKLVDTNGTAYEAVGYVYKDPRMWKVRYTKGSPLKGLNDAPQVSASTPDRTLQLVFIVSTGVSLKELYVGSTLIETFPKPITIEGR
jgi:hypothetical protein